MDDLVGIGSSAAGDFSQIYFIDHKNVDWRRVAYARYFFYHQFHYEYPGVIHDLTQRLVVIPPEQFGDQRLVSHHINIAPDAPVCRQSKDRFGNRVYECKIPEVERHARFEVSMTLERRFGASQWQSVSRSKAEFFLQPTRLTTPDEAIRQAAHDLHRQNRDPHALVEAINDWVYEAMSYGYGATDVSTTAAQALARSKGLCQDYAHIMIAICREIGLPARYVSGHMLGEGGSHAWVEVFLPTSNGDFTPTAFDPTNHRRPHAGYITVAIGRDYQDVSPTSGTFTAPYGGWLTCSKKAGFTHLEYRQ